MKQGAGSLLALLLAFVAMAALLLAQGGEPTPTLPTFATAQPTPEGAGRLFEDVTASDIQALELLDPYSGQSFFMLRDGSGAWIAPDLGRGLDQAQAESIARTVALMPVQRRFQPSSDANYDQYGIRPNEGLSLLVVIFQTSDEQAHAIIIGDPAEAADAAVPPFYAVVNVDEERPPVYLLDGSAVSYLAQMLSSPPLASS